MKYILIYLLLFLFQMKVPGQDPFTQANWIWPDYNAEPNTWAVFEKEFIMESTDQTSPGQFIINIAVDTKYWLWLNDSLIIREGGLKRGPTPYDTYFDQVLTDKRLFTNSNKIKILVWYWGVNGASHKSGGMPGLLFEMTNSEGKTVLKSDETWLSRREISFRPTVIPLFNNQNIISAWPVCFDASFINKEPVKPSVIIGKINASPWNRLYKRPIPFWKDSELTPYTNNPGFPFYAKTDTVIRCMLPYNMQVYPYIRLNSDPGKEIKIKTERAWAAHNLKSHNVYITADGVQDYEVPAWTNGHFVDYSIPKGVEILDLKYRETSYNSELAGSFTCSDDDLNILWKKSARSVILNMRDNYMDCPDRERAQWILDCSMISEFTYYALDRKADSLTKKMIREIINWKSPEGILWGAVPTGRFLGKYREFPGQTLLGIGVGFYQYFMNTGDSALIKEIYEPTRKYLLEVWEMEDNGLVKHRGPWGSTSWGPGTHKWYDWGSKDQDIYLLDNCWYYLCLKRARLFAEIAGKTNDIPQYSERMQSIEANFNNYFWQTSGYRSPDYAGPTDDRGNALSIYAGLASPEKWNKIAELLSETMMAGIGFEKTVLESLYMIGRQDIAFKRLKTRFKYEIESSYTTMPEGFGHNSSHGWGGAPLLIASKYIAGIAPLTPGYKQFSIKPQMGELTFLNTNVSTVKGNITVEIKREKRRSTMKVLVPQGATAKVEIPSDIIFKIPVSKIVLNGREVVAEKSKDKQYCVDLEEGEWILELK